MRRLAFVTLVLLVVAGCASGSGNSGGRKPKVDIEQLSKVARNVNSRSGLPVDYRITVQNPLEQAITLTAIEIETVGDSGAYRLRRVRHRFDRSIAPMATESIELRAWVTPLYASEVGDVTGPVSVRGLARFNSAGGQIQTTFSDRVQ